MKEDVSELLYNIGANPGGVGFDIMKGAIEFAVKKIMNNEDFQMKSLYETLGIQYKKTPKAIEQILRRELEYIVYRGPYSWGFLEKPYLKDFLRSYARQIALERGGR